MIARGGHVICELTPEPYHAAFDVRRASAIGVHCPDGSDGRAREVTGLRVARAMLVARA